MVRIDVGFFLHKTQGSHEEFDINESIEFDPSDNIKLTTKITAHVFMLKLPHEINVQISDIKTAVLCVCSRCLKSFLQRIEIPFAEREFIIDLPSRLLTQEEDVQYVDKTTHEILLDPVLREEILLHFPSVPVCSEGCKGLCDQCGVNLNKTSCSCVHITETKVTPFKFPLNPSS